MQALAVETAVRLLAVTQPGSGFDVDVSLGQGLAGGAVGAFLTTLVVGAIAVSVFPERTEALMAAVVEDPVESFVYGILALFGLGLLTLVLVFTIIGIVLAVPLLFVAYVLWAVGAAVAYLAIADRLVGHDDGWLKALLLAAGLNGALAATGIGSVVALAVGAAGFGTILRPYFD
jgi:hypothetical protein